MIKLVTISDYYLQDVPKGTLFLPHNVSSLPDEYTKPGHMVNRTKWCFHDKPATWNNSILSKGHNYISFLGKGLKALVVDKPDNRILQHWSQTFGTEFVPDFASWGTKGWTIVKFPMESLPANLHSVDGDTLYRLNSKKFIGEINVPQAKILDEFQPPCVVKVTHGSDGARVYFVHTMEEYLAVLDELSLPRNEIVITELIQDVVTTHCSHFYVTKTGEVQWISTAVQCMPGEKPHGLMEWTLKIDEQEVLKQSLYPLCKIVGEALHKEGYFGYCGTDWVTDRKGLHYLVDINPRVNGSTSLHLSTLHLHDKKGYTFGSHRRGVPVTSVSLDELITKLENIEKGMAVLVSALPDQNGLRCGIRVYTNSIERIDEIFTEIHTFCNNENS